MTAHEIVERNLYKVAEVLMDDEIREQLHTEIVPCSDEEFLIAYMKAHEEKYGLPFVV